MASFFLRGFLKNKDSLCLTNTTTWWDVRDLSFVLNHLISLLVIPNDAKNKEHNYKVENDGVT